MIRIRRRKPAAARTMDLAPLIDIIFNLLIFFLITAVLSAKGIEIDLPEAVSSEKMSQKSIEVMISAQGLISINREPLEWADFERLFKIEGRKKDSSSRKVILKAEKNTPFHYIVKVIDTARIEGFTNLVIATDSLRPVEHDKQ